MWGPRRLLPAMAVAALVLGPAAGAPASVRLGPDLTPPSGIVISPGFTFAGVGCQPLPYSPCAFVNLRSTNPDVPVAATTGGIITKWQFRIGCCGSTTGDRTMTLRTFKQGTHDGDFGYGYIIPTDTPGPSFVVPSGNQLLSEPPVSLPARMPINAGERVGVMADDAFFISVYGPTGVTATDVANGYVDRGEGYGTARPNVAWGFNAVMEPDADGDGYGDETQDCSPADPAKQGSCPPPPGPSVPTPLSVGGSSSGPPACGNSCPSKGAAPIILGNVGPVPSGDGSRIYIALTCPPNSVKPCGGFLVIAQAPAKKAGAAAAKILGRTAYSVAPGASKRFTVSLNKSGRALLRRRGRLAVRITVRPENGTPKTITRTLRHRAPKTRR